MYLTQDNTPGLSRNIRSISSRLRPAVYQSEYIAWTANIDILTSGYRKYTDSGMQNPMHVYTM